MYKEIANNLFDKSKIITLRTNKIQVIPLISRAKRVILSNVCLIIPYDTVEKILEKTIERNSGLN